MGSAHSGHGLGWTVGLTAGAFFAAGVVALAAGTSGTGAADGGIPDNPIPLVGTCSGDPPPCTLANGCAGVKICHNGVYSGCACAGGGDNIACTACGVAGTKLCSSSCTPGSCSAPPPQSCNPNGCQFAGTQTCNVGTNQWNACTGCSGAISCTTTCSSTGSGTCSSSTCAFSGSCTPPGETCNGRDDDCNGLVDDGITCAACDGL